MLNDETNTLAIEPETTIETPAPETEIEKEQGPESLDANDGPEADELPENGDAPGTEEDHAEFATIDYDGEQFQVPPKLKEAFLRQQDYTRKTQEVARLRQQAEDRAQYIEAREQFMNAAFAEASELQVLRNELQRYQVHGHR
mgnify:CR=1 FL=1